MPELKIEQKMESGPDCVLLKLQGNLDLFTFAELKKAFAKPTDSPDPGFYKSM